MELMMTMPVFGLVYSGLIVLKAEVGELVDECCDAN